MNFLEKVCSLLAVKGLDAYRDLNRYGVYTRSLAECEGSFAFMMKLGPEKKLVIYKKTALYDAFSGDEYEYENQFVKVCNLNHENCGVLREKFPYTAPCGLLKSDKTIGLGDRLGLATPGHIRLIEKYDIKPVFAQQSIRELNLTGRNYNGVLDDASWAVFQEGYKGGFGADGDHLKTEDEVEMALGCGFTMITLDCSEHIDNSITGKSDEEVDLEYSKFDASLLEKKYLDMEFTMQDGTTIKFGKNELKRIILTYRRAIEFAAGIYNSFVKNSKNEVDFEMSIDETLTPTSPQAHFFVASELVEAGVDAATIAPRFCGEFQKGIDYIGDMALFEKEFKVHALIARHFGYKISVHSGSDKFSVFPIVGRETKGNFHVKTAGTNWLEAIRVIAKKDPGLYREIHAYALSVLDEAKRYYHIGADVNKIADLNELKDEELPGLMSEDDSRQVIHITYGLILKAKKDDGSWLFRDRMYQVLNTWEEDYYMGLYSHIEKHIRQLGCKET